MPDWFEQNTPPGGGDWFAKNAPAPAKTEKRNDDFFPTVIDPRGLKPQQFQEMRKEAGMPEDTKEFLQGINELWTGEGEGRAMGASRILRSLGKMAGIAFAPAMAGAAAMAPAAAAGAVVGGMTGQAAVEAAGKTIGMGEGPSRLAGDVVGSIVGGSLGARVGPSVARTAKVVASSPAVREAAIDSIPGAKLVRTIAGEVRGTPPPAAARPGAAPPPAETWDYSAPPQAPARVQASAPAAVPESPAPAPFAEVSPPARMGGSAVAPMPVSEPYVPVDPTTGLDPAIVQQMRARRAALDAERLPPEMHPQPEPALGETRRNSAKLGDDLAPAPVEAPAPDPLGVRPLGNEAAGLADIPATGADKIKRARAKVKAKEAQSFDARLSKLVERSRKMEPAPEAKAAAGVAEEAPPKFKGEPMREPTDAELADALQRSLNEVHARKLSHRAGVPAASTPEGAPPAKPPKPKPAAAPAAEEDLVALLQQSLDAVKARKAKLKPSATRGEKR